jgi:hypothetical protein
VQKVAGLPRRDSSQPDWKFLHQRKRTVPGEEMKLKTSHGENKASSLQKKAQPHSDTLQKNKRTE